MLGMRSRREHWNNNPTGVGGFQFRRQDIYIVGSPAVPQCGATCKRTGKPCRSAPTKGGGGRCRHHGGGNRGSPSGRGKVALPKSLRQGHSKTMALVRRAARAELAATTLHPDTMKVFARYQNRIYPPDEEIFVLALDQRLKGAISTGELEIALQLACRYFHDPSLPRPEPRRRPAKRAASSPQPLVRPLGEVLREDLLERLKNAPAYQDGAAVDAI